MTHRVLILGGTTEARQLAERVAGRAELSATLSLAGRTQNPVPHAIPVRSGGFGGAEGLAQLSARRKHWPAGRCDTSIRRANLRQRG